MYCRQCQKGVKCTVDSVRKGVKCTVGSVSRRLDVL